MLERGLFYAGFALIALGGLSLIYPLSWLRIRTRAAALLVMATGFLLVAIGAEKGGWIQIRLYERAALHRSISVCFVMAAGLAVRSLRFMDSKSVVGSGDRGGRIARFFGSVVLAA